MPALSTRYIAWSQAYVLGHATVVGLRVSGSRHYLLHFGRLTGPARSVCSARLSRLAGRVAAAPFLAI